MNLLRLFVFTFGLSISWYFYCSLVFVNVLAAALKYLSVFFLLSTIHAAFHGDIYLDFVKRPFTRSHVLYWLSGLNKVIFAATLVFAVDQALYIQVWEQERIILMIFAGLLFAAVIISCVFPRKRIDAYFNLFLLIATATIGRELYRVYAAPPIQNAVVLAAPFDQEFAVLSGGNSRLNNMKKMHRDHPRVNAIHLIATPSQYTVPREGVEAYGYTFGQTILAPCSGQVIDRVNTIPDNPPRQTARDQGPGNYIVIEKEQDQYVVLAHLKQNSIQVEVGEQVTVGQSIAQCGKSGFVTEASLFLVVFDKPNVFDPRSRSQMIFFEGVKLLGTSDPEGVYYPQRGDYFIP